MHQHEELLDAAHQSASTKTHSSNSQPTTVQRLRRLLAPVAYIGLGVAASIITSKRR